MFDTKTSLETNERNHYRDKVNLPKVVICFYWNTEKNLANFVNVRIFMMAVDIEGDKQEQEDDGKHFL